MALTNLLSLQDDLILNKVCKHYIRDIEYCQFSSHELVRQAATECFCNMIYNDDFHKVILPENIFISLETLMGPSGWDPEYYEKFAELNFVAKSQGF